MATQLKYQPIVPSRPQAMPAGFQVASHVAELDGLRGVAAIWVILHHIALQFPPPWHGPFRHWTAFCHAGWMGVDLFFALSGFLITRILVSTRSRPHFYRNFYARRVLRLVPVYLLTLMLVAIFIPHSGAFLLLSFFYLANFAPWFHIPAAYSPLWSLAVEEHFYLVWPWLVRFINRRALTCISLCVVLGSPLLRYAAELGGWYDAYLSWFRFDGLAWGALLALVATSPGLTRGRLIRFSLGVGGVGVATFLGLLLAHQAARETRLGTALVFGLVSMAATSVIGLASARAFSLLLAPLRLASLRFLGDISYWAYMFHDFMVMAALFVIRRWLPQTWAAHGGGAWVFFAVFVFTPTILTGTLVRRWIELPVLGLRKHFRSSYDAGAACKTRARALDSIAGGTPADLTVV